ncbi:Alpha-glucosidase [Venturia nashicola]|uniref:Alpha-glucosidase n=1 Tax=Venturia nashicola TaxID=86259 RepID=A0A4Z1PI30_9PEZI|nr:Alpha-glucosidase [Venturia nashicola]
MDIINSYALGTGAWLAVQATPLLFTPKLIITMLSEEMHEHSSLETYLSRTSGLTLLFFALLTTLLTGTLPLTSTPSDEESKPYATPTLLITLTYHTLTAFYLYAHYTQTGISGFVIGAVGSGLLAAMGLWCMMFGGGSHISRRTGKDKRVSGFPFNNKEAKEAKGKRTF